MTRRAALLACALAILAPSIARAQNPSFGMTVHWLDTNEKWIPIERLGTGWVRFGQPWADIQLTDGQHFDWFVVDTFMANARRRGFKVLFDLGGTPDWAKADSLCALAQRCRPDMSSWSGFVRTAIDRYSGTASAAQNFWMGRNIVFGIWNEPDLLQFFDGDSSAYADLAIAATTARDAANPDAVVVVGNMTSGAVQGGANAWFSKVMHDRGLASHLAPQDIIGVHKYPPFYSESFSDVIDRTLAIADNRETWVTETGSSFPGCDDCQAWEIDRIATAFLTRTQSRWTKIFFWQLGGRDFNFLRDTDDGDNLNARPAYYTLQRHIPGLAHYWAPIEHDFLLPGQSLSVDEPLSSYAGEYHLVIRATGSMVVADSAGDAIWSTGKFAGGRCELAMELDGNLVLRDLFGLVLWESGTAGYPGAYLNIDRSGRLWLYSVDGLPLWTNAGGL